MLSHSDERNDESCGDTRVRLECWIYSLIIKVEKQFIIFGNNELRYENKQLLQNSNKYLFSGINYSFIVFTFLSNTVLLSGIVIN